MTRDQIMDEKKLAAYRSVDFISEGMVVGLGTGSTAAFMIQRLGKEVAKGLSVVGVPSSEQTAQLAKQNGIVLTTLEEVGVLDIYIDGADEIDPQLRLIKGGGGALLHEKILAYNSKFNIIIADSTKQVAQLGQFKLPVETIPAATRSIFNRFESMGLKPHIRKQDASYYTTDERNYIVDIDILGRVDLAQLNTTIIEIPGVVETGLFLDLADMVLVGQGQEVLEYRNKERGSGSHL